jgi:hypothetical protein
MGVVGTMSGRALPKSKAARGRLIKRNSLEYLSRMGAVECDRLLFAMAKLEGLTRAEEYELMDEVYNVTWEYVPDRLKE